MKITQITAPEGFQYDTSVQRSPEWLAIRTGRVGASDLYRWLAVSKKDGKPLKARSDLEREIAFTKAFSVPFSRYTTAAMQAGIDQESFVRDQYSSQMGVVVEEAGCFYSDYFVASPDGLVGEDGGLEIKWLQDTNWTEVLTTNVPLPDHYKQIQGNLYASGRKWWDYVAANGNTGRFVIIRVERDEELIAEIADSVRYVSKIKPLASDNVFQFSGTVPEITNEEIWTC